MSAYFFGDASSAAQLYLDQMASFGPKVPLDLDRIAELEPKQAKVLMAKLYSVCSQALDDEIDSEVKKIILKKYDAVFAHVLTVDDELREAVRTGRHTYMGGPTVQNIMKYKRLAGILA